MTAAGGADRRAVLERLCDEITQPRDGSLPEATVRIHRGRIAQLLANTPDAALPALATPPVRRVIRSFCGLQLYHHDLSPAESDLLDRLHDIATTPTHRHRQAARIASCLFRMPWQAAASPDLAAAPTALLAWWTELAALPPQMLPRPGDADRVLDFTQALTDELEALLAARPADPAVAAARGAWVRWSCVMQCYFTDRPLRPLMAARARLIAGDVAARWPGLTDWRPRPADAAGPIRIGVLLDPLSTGSETLFTLAHYERLPRPAFAVTLLSRGPITPEDPADAAYIARVIAAADRYVRLPDDIAEAAGRTRALDLDLLLFGNNLVSSANKASVQLASLRLARCQVATMCSPTTTGFATMDAYLSADAIQPARQAETDYGEALWRLSGGIKQFAMPVERPTSNLTFNRARAGIPDSAVVLMSGANYFKIIPELSRIWLEILRDAPRAHLVLFPFNPNWSPTYCDQSFRERLKQEATAIGVDIGRVTLLVPLPHPADTLVYLRIADLYLDSYPYAGAVSLYDPLTLGLPVVAWEGRQARTRQGASILRSLGLTDLIAGTGDTYRDLALRLIGNATARQAVARRVLDRVGPAAGDPLNDGRDLEHRLAGLLRHRIARASGAPDDGRSA